MVGNMDPANACFFEFYELCMSLQYAAEDNSDATSRDGSTGRVKHRPEHHSSSAHSLSRFCAIRVDCGVKYNYVTLICERVQKRARFFT